MAIFNSYVSHYQRVIPQFETPKKKHLHHQGHLFLAETHGKCVARSSLPFWVDGNHL